MQSTKPDLVISDLTERPVRRLVVNVADVQPGILTLLEALDIAEASEIDTSEFVEVLQRGTLRKRAALLYAFAWVVARRVEPDLTYQEVCTYQLEVVGSKGKSDASQQKRAEAVVAVASLAGVSPREAEQMTLAEVSAISDLQKRRTVKRTQVRRKRAG